MALTKDLQIYKDNYNLCKLFLQYNKQVSKLLRYGQYQIMIDKSFSCLDFLRRINSDFNTREYYLEQYLLLLDDIYNRVSLFVETGYIEVKKGTNMIHLVSKLQKQATGWKNFAHKSQNCKGTANTREQSLSK